MNVESCYASTGQTASYTDFYNDDSTVTDRLAGLVWLQNANCRGGHTGGAVDTAMNRGCPVSAAL